MKKGQLSHPDITRCFVVDCCVVAIQLFDILKRECVVPHAESALFSVFCKRDDNSQNEHHDAVKLASETINSTGNCLQT